MVKPRDPLRVLEAAYSFEPDERLWMRGLLEAIAGYDLGPGLVLYVAELGKPPGFRSFTGSTDFDERLIDACLRVLPARIWRNIHLPRQLALNAVTMRDVAKTCRFDAQTAQRVIERRLGRALPLAHTVTGGDGDETVILGLCSEGSRSIPSGTREALDAVGAHLGVALRLRKALGGAPNGNDDAADAVLSPAGKVLEAKSPAARASLVTLVEAAKRTERARSRSASAEERLSLWTALFDGHWSILESKESDGKRLLLACRNPPRTMRLRKLSARERSVAHYAALGHPLKYISYELGLGVATVSLTLRSALRKLGLGSRAELIRAFGVGGRL